MCFTESQQQPCGSVIVIIIITIMNIHATDEETQMFNNLSKSSSYQEAKLGSKSSLFGTVLHPLAPPMSRSWDKNGAHRAEQYTVPDSKSVPISLERHV